MNMKNLPMPFLRAEWLLSSHLSRRSLWLCIAAIYCISSRGVFALETFAPYSDQNLTTSSFVTLPNGNIVGFGYGPTFDTYDAATGWSHVNLQQFKSVQGAAPILGGPLAGQILETGSLWAGSYHWLYNPSTQQVTPVPYGPSTLPGSAIFVSLPTGEVLYMGSGTASNQIVPSAVYMFGTDGQWAGGRVVAPWADYQHPMAERRIRHTATLLLDGTILLFGGVMNPLSPNSYVPAHPEIYSASSSTVLAIPPGWEAVSEQTVTRLLSGSVLITGGRYSLNSSTPGSGSARPDCLLYDPTSASFVTIPSMNVPRYAHTATIVEGGKVLVTGGFDQNYNAVSSAELFDPASPQSGWVFQGELQHGRAKHAAVFLSSSNQVLVAGGELGYEQYTQEVVGQIYNPYLGYETGSSVATPPTNSPPVVTLSAPQVSGNVYSPPALIGLDAHAHDGDGAVTRVEFYEGTNLIGIATGTPAVMSWTLVPSGIYQLTAKAFDNAGASSTSAPITVMVSFPDPTQRVAAANIPTERRTHAASLLSDGKVLVTGGINATAVNGYLSSAVVYNPTTNTWTAATGMPAVRGYHTSTTLNDGRVLVAGGSNVSVCLNSAVLYNPGATGSATWTATPALATARNVHTATLLDNGDVLVVGGSTTGGTYLKSAELYTPVTGAAGSWTSAGNCSIQRRFHTACAITNDPSNRVVVAGGINASGYTDNIDIYTPGAAGTAGTWTPSLVKLTPARAYHTATALPNGKILFAGGYNGSTVATTQIYDPATDSITTLSTGLNTSRSSHTAVLLTSGKVLVAGGYHTGTAETASVEIFDPNSGSGSWTTEPFALGVRRQQHTMTLLDNGKVLITGGTNNNAVAPLWGVIWNCDLLQ